MNKREVRAKINIVVSLICQIISLICGIILPRSYIQAYGSEAYGTTASITQFLAYITLLEGGIAGVARAALYKPLAQNDSAMISSVVYEIKRFFRAIAYIFVAYTVILACTFTYISDVQCFDWISTFFLVFAISISTFGQYFIGISYSILIQANQRQYVTNAVNVVTMIINTVIVVLLIHLGCNIIWVKLVSSIIFLVRPVVLYEYVRKNFQLITPINRNKNALSQKWTGFGQHIAYFLHTNASVTILTLFYNLTVVAVYSVYNMIVYSMQNFCSSFSAGMEAVLGDMLAKKENKQLQSTFEKYETLLSVISVILYSITAVMIVPFVVIYTKGITDAEYSEPLFALFLTISSCVFCLRLPYHNMIIAAGKFKETKIAAYGEAILNILLSCIFVVRFGLVGVAIGTLIAVVFRFVFYAVYLSRNVIHRSIKLFIKRTMVNSFNFAFVYIIGGLMLRCTVIDSYFDWIVWAILVALMAALITFIVQGVMFRTGTTALIRSIMKSSGKKKRT